MHPRASGIRAVESIAGFSCFQIVLAFEWAARFELGRYGTTTFYAKTPVKPTEFIIPERPLSVQAKDRSEYQAWKQLVVLCALPHWRRAPVTSGEVRLTIVFLCDDTAPIDVDNVVKPIQDALLAVAYSDDVLVTDVDSHRRYLHDAIDLTNCSASLIDMLTAQEEAVYVRLQEADVLGTYL